MKLFTVIYNDARLLVHFLRHYESAGVRRFFVACSPEFVDETRRLAEFYPIQVFAGLDVINSLLTGTDAVSAMRHRCQSDDEWSIIVDLDEFIEFGDPIHVLVSTAEREYTNVMRGLLYDRFTADGDLPDLAPDADLSKVFPVKSRFVREVMGGCDHKGVLVRGRLRPVPGAGHHLFEDERVCSKLLEISHYKWTLGAIERLRISHRRVLRAGLAWEGEYRKVLEHYDRYGRFAWETFGGQLSEDFVPVVPQRCADCAAPLSEAEYEFSTRHLGKALCRMDQKKHRNSPGNAPAGDGGICS